MRKTRKQLEKDLFHAEKNIEALWRDNGALRKIREQDGHLLSWQNERIQQWSRVVDAAEAYTRTPNLVTASELRVATKAWKNSDNAKERDEGKRAFAKDSEGVNGIGHNSGNYLGEIDYGK